MTGYYIGTLGNALPVPGGIGGVEGGMIGAFLGFGLKGSLATLAVLGYRTISYWLPTGPGRSPTSICEVGTIRRARANTSRLNEREGNLGGQTLTGTERLRDSASASRSHRATISPNTNPPTWAKNATPPPLAWAEVRP